jgi:hypothetical protein
VHWRHNLLQSRHGIRSKRKEGEAWKKMTRLPACLVVNGNYEPYMVYGPLAKAKLRFIQYSESQRR